MQNNKFSYTAPEAIYPAYVSLNERDGFYYLSVRGVRKINGDAGDTIEAPIPRAELRKLSDALRDDRATECCTSEQDCSTREWRGEGMTDIGMPKLPQSMESNGWQFISDETPRGTDVLVWHAQLAIDEDTGDRTGVVVGYVVYVSARDVCSSGWDEPESISCAPSASWLNSDWEYADAPSLWRPMPPLMDMSGLDQLRAALVGEAL